MITERLGIDLGNTIISRREPLPDAFRVIRRLIDHKFGVNVHIVSRVDEQQEVRARAFVFGARFQLTLGIPADRIHFCRKRSEKGPICSKFRITHFIDDRPEVMAAMPPTVTERILFNPRSEELERFRAEIGVCRIVRDWLEVERLFFPV